MTRHLPLRLCTALCSAFAAASAWAQGIDDTEGSGRGRGSDSGLGGIDDFVDYQPFHISTSDIILVVLLIVACYVFGKIWKGCSYLIIVIAAVMFYLVRYA